MKTLRKTLKEYETRAERVATGKEHMIKDSVEDSKEDTLDEDVEMDEDSIIKKPDVVTDLDKKGIDVKLTDKQLGESKKKVMQKKKVIKESIMDFIQPIMDLWNSSKSAMDVDGVSELTQGELFHLATYTILGVSAWLSQNQLIALAKKAPEKFKKLLRAAKIIKSGNNVESQLNDMGIDTNNTKINEAIKRKHASILKESKVKALIALIEKRTGKKVSFIVENKKIVKKVINKK